MKRFLSTVAAVGLSASVALAANIPYFPGPVDPSNLTAAINNLIGSLNANTGGLLAAASNVVTTDANADTALAYTIPGGTLNQVGQTIQVTAWGVNSADANAKTLTYNFGALAVACVVTASAAKWEVEFTIMKTGANAQVGECHGTEGTTVVGSVQPAAGTVTDTVAIATTLTQTAATAGTMTLAAATINSGK